MGSGPNGAGIAGRSLCSALPLADRAGAGAARLLRCWLLEGGWLAGLPHLPRPRDVYPGIAVNEEALWQAAEVSVIIWCLYVCEACFAAAHEPAAGGKVCWKVPQKLPAHNVSIPGAAGAIQEGLGKPFCAVLIWQPM